MELCKNPDFHLMEGGQVVGERPETVVVIGKSPMSDDYAPIFHATDVPAAVDYIKKHRAGERGWTYKIKDKEGRAL